ncbi:MAG: tetratricopeptide repeat protein [Lachnospiraceae bacterium]|nr:tetratricopeptide repeat protein [Lachnospiraceae bacterium]
MVYECVGRLATTPYYVEGACINIFSIEELAYYIYENAIILDDTLMKKELCSFIDKELGLRKLADELTDIIEKEEGLSKFAGTVLRFLDYCPNDKIEEIEKSVSGNGKAGNLERRRARGDMLLKSKKYMAAIREYDQALSYVENVNRDNKDEVAKLLNNLGVAYARMFYFDNAADCFMNSLNIKKDQQTMLHYLAAKRLSMKSTDYIRVVQEGAYKPQFVNKVEKNIDKSVRELENTPIYQEYKDLRSFRGGGKIPEYNRQAEKMVGELKSEYRDHYGHEYY